ncbi:MAG: metal-dependent hydrolase [bacterium]
MFLDIGVGILVAIFTSQYYSIHLGELLVLGGILFALCPDADFLLHFFKRGISREDYQHRNMIHYPLLFLPLGTWIAFLLGGNVWAMLFFFCAFFHFLHDSVAIGWGIKWLYPFSSKNFVFLYHYSRIQKRGLRKLVFAFDKNTLTQMVSQHWSDEWFHDIYYKWHPIAVVEFGVFLISVATLYFYV